MKTDENEPEVLARLAAAYGIQCSYFDVYGNFHEMSPETIKQMLVAMGVDASRPEEALQRVKHLPWTRLAEPVLVESAGRLPSEFVLQVPASGSAATQLNRRFQVRFLVTGEDGLSINYSYRPEQLTFKESKEIDSITYERWGVPFPAGLSLGYYQFDLTVTLDKQEYEQTISVILCPDTVYLPSALEGDGKRAGIAIALYGLRSQRNWGVGDFSDLKEFIRWATEYLHVDVIGLNPLHAISNRRPYNISPYFPSSRFYRNFIYLDIESMEDYRFCSAAKKLVQAKATQGLLTELRNSEVVQYEQVAEIKLKVLQLLFETFLQRNWRKHGAETERGREFEAYIKREGSLLDNFAICCALEVFFHEMDSDVWVWRQWPEPFRNPFSKEVQDFRRSHWDKILFYKYLQWQLETQLQSAQDLACSMGASVGLYHDLATGIDPAGADQWAYGDFFVGGMKVGAPPDDFSLEGQDWGFQPPNKEKHRNGGYSLFGLEIRKNCQAGGALRIDHIMRFFRLFWISADQPPRHGTYVEDYYQDLLRILALESERANTLIIGEDLGTVPPQTREILAQFGIFSYRLFYFEREEHGFFKDPESYPSLALAAVSTHDLPTLAGFWTGEDISLRNRLGMFPSEEQFHAALEKRRQDKKQIVQRLITSGFLAEEMISNPEIYAQLTHELHQAIIGFLLSTPAKLVILSQEDLIGDTRQQNLPGTTLEYANWSTKMRYSLEELWQDPEVAHYARVFRQWVDTSGRAIPVST
jgi:4-alpha-glucanotransferase